MKLLFYPARLTFYAVLLIAHAAFFPLALWHFVPELSVDLFGFKVYGWPTVFFVIALFIVGVSRWAGALPDNPIGPICFAMVAIPTILLSPFLLILPFTVLMWIGVGGWEIVHEIWQPVALAAFIGLYVQFED
ncbi:hypothetical protein [Ponticoccus litoralis]|uniref:Uncharacterized protein n=1 Tax=Ponticoccus litoralis TaxID=422297 RepID=A0AAW9STP5_9RHOB